MENKLKINHKGYIYLKSFPPINLILYVNGLENRWINQNCKQAVDKAIDTTSQRW